MKHAHEFAAAANVSVWGLYKEAAPQGGVTPVGQIVSVRTPGGMVVSTVTLEGRVSTANCGGTGYNKEAQSVTSALDKLGIQAEGLNWRSALTKAGYYCDQLL